MKTLSGYVNSRQGGGSEGTGAFYVQTEIVVQIEIVKRSASVLFLVGAVVVLYRKAIRLWWTYDDPWNLHVSIARPWTDAFTERDVWPQSLFTPLLLGSHEALLFLAGLDPDHWYRIQLALIAACASALYFALRLYVGTIPALTGALLFAAGPPLCSFATQLMVIHYLEAILLGVLAVIAYVLAFRRQSVLLELLSALLYFAAMLAKEIAVPLPALLFFLPPTGLRVRIRHLLFHTVALVGYLSWRWSVIGTVFGGYGWAIAPGEIPGVLMSLPWKVILACAGAGLGVGLAAMAVLAGGAGWAMRTRRGLLIGSVTLLLAVAPILPVSKEMQPRYVVAVWLWACVSFAIGAASLRSAARNALLVAAAGTVLVANRQEWTHEYGRSIRMSEEARAFMSLDGSAMLRLPAIPPAAMVELQWLKEEHLRGARGAGWFYDDLFLCGEATLADRRIFEWVPQRREVVEVTARIPDLARSYCGAIRHNAPLRAEFHHRDEALFWRFGPYDQGRWTVVLGGGLQAFTVPREEGFRLAGVPGLALRVRYESPEGWVTYSPEIALDFARQPNLIWHR